MPAGVTISSVGVFSVDNYSGDALTYSVTAYNNNGASNVVEVKLLDLAVSQVVLRKSHEIYALLGDTIVENLTPLIVEGPPATSWKITNSNGTATTNPTISDAGILTYTSATMGSFLVTAFNGAVESDPMTLSIFADDPCFIDMTTC